VTSFRDVRDYVAIPRLGALRLSPDGSWLAAVVQARGRDGKKFISSIWRIDPGGAAPARLTRSARGEASPEFLPDGSLLFISARPDPAGPPASDNPASDHKASDHNDKDSDNKDSDNKDSAAGEAVTTIPWPADPSAPDGDAAQDKPGLWLLPAAGGEPRRVASAPGGVTGVAAARSVRSVVLAVPTLPGAAGAGQDARRRDARKRAGVTALLHESGPARYWDHDLGPDQLRLMTQEIGPDSEIGGTAGHAGTAGPAGLPGPLGMPGPPGPVTSPRRLAGRLTSSPSS
jgi:dipeptidyl aminopeptidase/acylaminoacyl peptidase